MAVSQLSLYNEALRLIGERRLASISENREPRRVLDDVWNDGAVDFCLEQGQWNFAMRAVEITPSAVVPAFGFNYAFDKPTDFIRTAGVSEDESFNRPLLDTLEEVGFWFANITPIYVRYVSNATSYGNDFQRWPTSFAKFVAAFLASEICFTITQSAEKQNFIVALAADRLRKAKSLDAMADATSFLPQGGWSSARQGRRSRMDRGNRSNLIG